MAKAFAATMGHLALTVTLLRGVKDGAGVESTVFTAVAWMFVFAAVGAVVGWIAESTVDESVRRKLEQELSG